MNDNNNSTNSGNGSPNNSGDRSERGGTQRDFRHKRNRNYGKPKNSINQQMGQFSNQPESQNPRKFINNQNGKKQQNGFQGRQGTQQSQRSQEGQGQQSQSSQQPQQFRSFQPSQQQNPHAHHGQKPYRQFSDWKKESRKFVPGKPPIHQQQAKREFRDEKPKVILICQECQKTIPEPTAVFHNDETSTDLCFDCAIKIMRKKYDIPPKNKIIYLGAGTFGEIKELRSEKNFVILRRIKFCKPKFEKFAMSYLPENIESKDD